MDLTPSSASSGEYEDYFTITVEDLQMLMHHQGQNGVQNIEKFGGVSHLCDLLRTTPEHGITTHLHEMQARINTFGINCIKAKRSKLFYEYMLNAFKDPTLIFLEVAGILSVIAGLYLFFVNTSKSNDFRYDWIEGCVILASVLVIVIVTAGTDHQKEQQFRALKLRLKEEQKITVIRDGRLDDLSVDKILVGDICIIKYGNIIPADGIIIKSNDLRIDESSITGESELVVKNVNVDITLLAGTRVMEGNGKMVITAVGLNSQNGIILQLIGLNDDDKPKIRKSELMPSKSEIQTTSSSSKSSSKSKKKKKKTQLKEDSDLKIRKSFAKDAITQLRASKSTVPVNSNIKMQDSLLDIIRTSEGSILQKKLYVITLKITNVAIVVALLTVLILNIHFIVSFIRYDKKWETAHILVLIRYILIGISILIVAIPEGLPLAVTLALAYSVKKMMADNNLVRNLESCETMGNATTICSDKTGTLTTNQMSCVELFTCESLYSTDVKIPQLSDIVSSRVQFLIIEGISVNTSYTSYIEHLYDGRLQYYGDKTECALLGLVLDFNGNYQSIRNLYPDNEFLHVFTFNSIRKSMSTIIKKSKKRVRLYTKGGAEIVLKNCKYIFNRNGEIIELSDYNIEFLYGTVISRMANNGLRIILLAYRDFLYEPPIDINEILIDNELNFQNELEMVKNLTLISITGIEDPIRPDVFEAINSCQSAGITVRMVTGDNIQTAKAIAFKCGILKYSKDLNDPNMVMDGEQFNNLIRDANGKINQDLLDKVWPNLLVLARSRPIDKYILVKGIIETNIKKGSQIVAVTGDGTNDGPALKIADVGFAMGLTGTDVAKESSDIILTDDNFSSIVKALMWGRNVYDSITKFLQFQLTVNFVAILISFFGACYAHDTVLKSVQLLWVNLLMDALASLALATEKPTRNLLKRKPYSRTRTLISPIMWKNIISQAIYQISVLTILLFYLNRYNEETLEEESHANRPNKQNTIIFNTLVMMTLFNEINSRKINGEYNAFDGILQNKLFLIIWIGSFTIQIIIIQFGEIIFTTTPLNHIEWSYCLFFGMGTLVWAQLWHRIPIEIWVKKLISKCSSKIRKRGTTSDTQSITDGNETRVSRLLSQNHINTIKQLYRSSENASNKLLH